MDELLVERRGHVYWLNMPNKMGLMVQSEHKGNLQKQLSGHCLSGELVD